MVTVLKKQVDSSTLEKNSPSLISNAPRNMKLATAFTIFPSSTTLVILTFVFRTFKYRGI